MTLRYLTLFIIGLLAFSIMPQTSQAQVRPEDTFFIKPRIGIASHLGDTEKSPFNFNMDNWKVDGKFPFNIGAEIGYQFTPSVSLSGGFQYADYPLVFHYGDSVPPGAEDDDTKKFTGQLLLRLKAGGSTARVAPFLTLGAHISTGGSDGPAGTDLYNADTVYGPVAGVGLDIVLSDRTSLVFEWLSNFTFPDGDLQEQDGGIDGVEDTPRGPLNNRFFTDGFAGFDMLNSLTLGLQFNFKSAFTPVEVLAIDCPDMELEVGQTGTFTGTVNEADATKPLTYTWNFGDGSTAEGLIASHSYSSGGTYNVTFTAANLRSTDSASCTVRVREPVAAEVISISANPMNPCVPPRGQGDPVQFSSNVRGDTPLTYAWDFGDGNTGTGANPSHRYSAPGTYTVSLTVSNDGGSDTETMTLNVDVCEPEYCADITEMNPVYFERNSSTLSDEARASLQENLQILQDCPNICVTIEGWATTGERNAQQLAADRARAVEQYYIDNGIAASRITMGEMHVVRGMKKAGAADFRRADTIPGPCM